MPQNNAFSHQRFSAEKPITNWHLVQPCEPPAAGSAEYQRQMKAVGEAYRDWGVQAVWLIHGTFAGDDPLGLVRILESAAPQAARRWRQVNKQLFDKLAQDSGNYTHHYAAEFQRATGIRVERVAWSGENHHLARAAAAVSLLDQLAAANASGRDRVLLWGHSHAGNVLALLSNLLAADGAARRAFFEAARGYYGRGWFGGAGRPVWERVRQWLVETPPERRRVPQLDFVTFGTPIRYGWDTDGFAQLLH